MDFYPVGWRAISLLAIKKVFNWKNKDIRELGRFATAVSLVVRIYMKFFHSVDIMAKKAPEMWNNYFTIGSLSIPDYDEEKKYAVAIIKDINLHPVFCRTMEGYFENIVKMIVRAKKVRCHETECALKGTKCHRFLIKWQ